MRKIMSKNKKNKEQLHWLTQPETIKKLWKGGLFILFILLILDLIIPPHPYFEIDGTIGFYAWYGFLSCAFMVILAKIFGLIVKRPDTYYNDIIKKSDKNV